MDLLQHESAVDVFALRNMILPYMQVEPKCTIILCVYHCMIVGIRVHYRIISCLSPSNGKPAEKWKDCMRNLRIFRWTRPDSANCYCNWSKYEFRDIPPQPLLGRLHCPQYCWSCNTDLYVRSKHRSWSFPSHSLRDTREVRWSRFYFSESDVSSHACLTQIW